MANDALNPRQRAAVEEPSHLCLLSCPGSGKTRTIIAKLARCIDEVAHTPRQVACITYTNAAVQEIEHRLRRIGTLAQSASFTVDTIHTFCLNQILRPFFELHERTRGGFSIFSPQGQAYRDLAAEIGNAYSIRWRDLDNFQNIRRNLEGRIVAPGGISEAAANAFLGAVAEQGAITLDEIVFLSYELCRDKPFITRGLASRFSWLLVDEYQDTTRVQAEIFRLIANWNRTKFFVVGDTNQSIFSFTGARPELMGEMAGFLNARTDVVLNGNYRCSGRVVDLAERLLPLSPRMRAVGIHRDFGSAPRYAHSQSRHQAVMEHFLPGLEENDIPLGKAAVLAPWWTHLYSLGKQLRLADVPILGPGSRPYRRSPEFAQFAEAVCAYLYERTPEYHQRALKSLFVMLLTLRGQAPRGVYSYQGRRTLFRLIAVARECEEEASDAAAWLQAFGVQVGGVLVDAEMMTPSEALKLGEYCEAMILSILKNAKTDASLMRTEDLGLLAAEKDCLQLRTMHGAKGLEFDAVALVDVHDDTVPHFRAETVREI